MPDSKVTPPAILLCEPVCYGLEHATFNAALIETFKAAYPATPLHFYGEKEHIERVRAALSRATATDISWHPLALPPRHLYSLLRRLPQEITLWRSVLDAAATLGAPLVVACSSTAESILSLKLWLARPPYRHTRVLCFLHSVLANLERRRRNPLARIVSLARVLMVGNRGRLNYVVLSSAIAAEVTQRLPALRPYLRVLPFPYRFEPGQPKTLALDRPLRLAFLGGGSREKGFDWFVRLAREVAAARPGRAEFHLVGAIQGELAQAASELITVHGKTGMLPRPEFDALAARMDYAVVLHDPDFYRFIASGTILDALLHGLPPIARHSAAVSSYFAALGDIGYLLADYDQLREHILNLLDNPPVADYAAQSARLVAGRDQYAPESLAPALQAIVAPLLDTAA